MIIGNKSIGWMISNLDEYSNIYEIRKNNEPEKFILGQQIKGIAQLLENWNENESLW